MPVRSSSGAPARRLHRLAWEGRMLVKIDRGFSGRASRTLIAGFSLLAMPAALPALDDDDPPRIVIRARDVEASNREVAAAYAALVTMWKDEFERRGAPFRAPRIVPYRGSTITACGGM